jgi:hypothetical protein
MEQVAQAVVERMYPTPRYATVTGFNTTTRTVTVRYPDEPSTTFTIPCGTIMPSVIGATVRVVGRQGARYVDEIIDGNGSLRVMQLVSTTEADLSSTNHAFQIGSSDGVNLVADMDEIQARNNGAASTLSLNPHGGTVQLGGGGTPAQQVRIGDDTYFTDVNIAHTLGLVSTSDASRASLKFGSGPTIHGLSTYLHISSPSLFYADANTHYFRTAAGADRMYLDGNGLYLVDGWFRVIGNEGIFWETHGGGWFMQDTTWIRAYNGKWPLADRWAFSGTGYKFTHDTDLDTGLIYDGDGDISLISNGVRVIRLSGSHAYLSDRAILMRSPSDLNHGVNYANATPTGSGEASNGPILYGYSSVWLKCINGDKNFYLSSAGNVFINGGNTYQNFSSRELKDNIQSIMPEAALDHVMRWRPVEFDYKENGRHADGFIAEEMVEVTPSMVSVRREDEERPGWAYALAYSEAIPRLAGAIQALKLENDELRARLDAMEERLGS